MGYWKSKVLPKIKKVFEKNTNKKAAAEASKSFDDSKEAITKEFEEKKTELEPKVLEIYEPTSAEFKGLVKEPKQAGLKKQSTEVLKFLEDLDKIDFPGSKLVHEAATKFGPALVSGPVIFIFEKVSTFIVVEETPAATTTTEITEETTKSVEITEETSGSKDKDIVIEPEKKEEEPKLETPVKVEEPVVVAEPPKPPVKVEEPVVVVAEPPKP